jgi:hypothetical protein
LETVEMAIKGPEGDILPNAISSVSIVKDGGYCGEEFGEDPALEPDLAFRGSKVLAPSGFGHLRQRCENLLLNKIDILERIVKKVA